MNIYFGKVPTEYLDAGEYFYNSNGDAYYYILSIDKEGIELEDTVGRFIPFDLSELHALADAVLFLSSADQATKDLQHTLDTTIEGLARKYGVTTSDE